jgi:GMP synthase-like glutamine amidotransferase
MRVHILQHVPFEDIGSMVSWLAKREATIEYTRFYQSALLPEIGGLDLVIAMGGPMSVNDEASLPWLKAEKCFIREAIQRGVPVIGICLGAQLVASALGARVYPKQQKEIGWFEIEPMSSADDVFHFPRKCKVFHWHKETFDLPPGATRLARSAACENQAFQIGGKVLGLQFHLETTPQSADSIISHFGHNLIENPNVQTEAAMRAVPSAVYENSSRLMHKALAYITE